MRQQPTMHGSEGRSRRRWMILARVFQKRKWRHILPRSEMPCVNVSPTAKRRVIWWPQARRDREAMMDYIAQDNPVAALGLDDDFEARAALGAQRPTLSRAGRVRGTREVGW